MPPVALANIVHIFLQLGKVTNLTTIPWHCHRSKFPAISTIHSIFVEKLAILCYSALRLIFKNKKFSTENTYVKGYHLQSEVSCTLCYQTIQGSSPNYVDVLNCDALPVISKIGNKVYKLI